MTPAPKRLHDLTVELRDCRRFGDGDPLVHSLAYDSRAVQEGSLFVALRGLKADGAQFIRDAIARGAAAIVADTAPESGLQVPFIRVQDGRKALAELAWSFYDHPERSLTLAGITGTNGKTTVATQLRAVLDFAGHRTGLIGTLGIYYGEVAAESPRTTPESADLAAHFAAMRALGFTHAVMEATSIGIDLQRTWKLPFRATVFTNLTRDHLDYHGSVEAYRDAKLRLFQEQEPDGAAVINLDDPAANDFVKAARAKVLTYSLLTNADFRATNLRLTRQSTSFDLVTAHGTLPIEAPLIGHFNAQNLLAVIATAFALGVPLEITKQALAQAVPVPGRAEMVRSSAPFTVVVDYAHTPDALEKILSTLQALEHNRIFTVVGAGGDRDHGKRPLMAEVAHRLSDQLFLTSDNPRSEDPEVILNEMAAGLSAENHYFRNADRRLTIETALAEARNGDIVLIAGKGHESYQEIQGVKHPFDDRLVAAAYLSRAGYAL
ncbi:MAG TPA: UDP-N-acetylmuramoyl-L-alanyl-D-glutamate--2,6-diaminopimelate ligase [bacterium]|jgi:UDP-N-acetylmuramoyl-L-alanyl-D-glutamate--2,6-diaminopimelate ligase